MAYNFHNIFISIFILFIIYIYIEQKNNDIKYITSNIDNKKYLVRNVSNSQDAADLLANTKYKLLKLCEYLKKKNNNQENVKTLISKFNPENLSESTKNSKYTSYSVNKGEKIVLCMRQKDKEENLVDPNILMFVALHELSHIMTKSIGHTEEFWNNFKFLLQNAIIIGIYKHVDYGKTPEKYCGITVTDTPL